ALAQDSESMVYLAAPQILKRASWSRPRPLIYRGPMAIQDRGEPSPRTPAATRRVPWSPPAWRQALYLAGGIPAQILLLCALALPASAVKPKKFAPLEPLWLIFVLLVLPPALTAIHRHRLRATGGVEIPRLAPQESRWSWPGIVAYARAKSTWRQVGYHLVA